MPTLLFLKHKTSLKTTIKSHMEKICIPLHFFGEFDSQQQALTILKQKGCWHSLLLSFLSFCHFHMTKQKN